MKVTLRFDLTGRIACLHHEAVDLRQLGRLTGARASDLRFEPRTQQWEVRCVKRGALLFTHPSRLTCVSWEQENLQPHRYPHPQMRP